MLEIKNLYAGYSKDNYILKGIDLTIGAGEAVGILGRNGSGKSTLAKAICGLMTFVSGDIFIDGRQILGKRPYEIANLGVGYFQQGGRIFRNLSVAENLEFACSGMRPGEKHARIKQLKDWFVVLQKDDRLRMKASYLSGGEKHQLALAMVLAKNPKFLILDEPSAGISPVNQQGLYSSIKSTNKMTSLPLLLIEQNHSVINEFASKNL